MHGSDEKSLFAREGVHRHLGAQTQLEKRASMNTQPATKLLEATAFSHVPELAGKLVEHEKSFFRISRAKFDEWDERARALGHSANWRRSHEEREAIRSRVLAGRLDPDLWLVAYGSLMWDPRIQIVEIRRATLAGYHRRFCLRLSLGRGSLERPGLMLALDEGGSCDGLAFRIPAAVVNRETDILWMREMSSEAYTPVFVPIDTPNGPLEALAFIADRGAGIYCRLDAESTAQAIASATGLLGSNLSYLDNICEHLAVLRISDP